MWWCDCPAAWSGATSSRASNAVKQLAPDRHIILAGLTGQVADVPYGITANMLILQLAGTSLQNECAQPGDAVSLSFDTALHFCLPITNQTTIARQGVMQTCVLTCGALLQPS